MSVINILPKLAPNNVFTTFTQIPTSFEIVFSDPWFVVVHKPHGMATHPGRGIFTPSALETLRKILGSWVYPIHRLDQATSGLLLFGRTPDAARAGQKMIQSPHFVKTYIALVRGYLPQSGTIEAPIDQKPACSSWETINTFEEPWPSSQHPTSRYSLVYLHPKTGRTHQLRRHLHHISHPIIGDSRYGDGFHNKIMKEISGEKRLCLHSISLSGIHPMTMEPVIWTDPFGFKT